MYQASLYDKGRGFAVGCGFDFAVDAAKKINDARPRNQVTQSYREFKRAHSAASGVFGTNTSQC